MRVRNRRAAAAQGLLPAVLVPIFAAVAPSPAAAHTATSAANAVLAPAADAYVRADRPRRRTGSQRLLVLRRRPATIAYLRFPPPQLGPGARVWLQLRARTGKAARIEVRRIARGRWSERSLRYRTRPRLGAVAGRSARFRGRAIVRVDVTRLVAGGRPVSLALTTRGRRVTVASRERASRGPRLIVAGGAANGGGSPGAGGRPGAGSSPPPAGDVQPAFPIRAAFYYPWFPEAWDQKGIYPYTRYHPTLGFYDGAATTVIQRHIQAMTYGGIEAGIASWWGPGSREDRKLPALLATTKAMSSPFRWALYHETESTGDPSAAEIASDLSYIAARYGSDPAYLRVNGRPVIFVYADDADGCAMADRWRLGNATARFHLVLKVLAGYKSCASQPAGWHQYAPAAPADSQAGHSFAISPGFYKADEAGPRLARDVGRFRRNAADMVASGAPWQLVTTFNEWGEGTSVESADEWSSASGHGRYLDALRQVGDAPPAAADPVIAAAGDIACDPADGSYQGGLGGGGRCRQLQTSDLLFGESLAAVLTLGDNQYEDGTLEAFRTSFEPSWGRMKHIMRPAVGNHEYHTPNAAGYFDYFNGVGQATGRAGDRAKGYYSFDVGAWHLIALNSNCSKVGGCNAGSPQEQWLRGDLAAHPSACTLAYWHHPRFSSGEHGDTPGMTAIWQALQDAAADVVLSGHDHNYERFAPQTAPGQLDVANGLRQFVVGTGGKSHYSVGATRPNSEVHQDDAHGILRLTLRSAAYDWRFVSESGAIFSDSGTSACH